MNWKVKSDQAVKAALILYAMSTCLSMSFMNAAMGILLVVTLSYLPELMQPLPSDLIRFWRASCWLIGACLLSLIFAWYHPLQLANHSVIVHFGQDMSKTWYFLLPFWFFLMGSKLSSEHYQKLIKYWLFAAFGVSALAFLQFYTGFPRPQSIPDLPGRFHATLFFGHHLSTASILIFPFFVLFTLGFSKCSYQGWHRSWMILGAWVLGSALFFTWSRMLWIALPVGIGIWCLRGFKKKYFLWLTPCLVFAYGMPFAAIQARFLNSMGVFERFELWKVNWYCFLQRPFLGIGFRKSAMMAPWYFQEKDPSHQYFVSHAHNNMLEMLSGVGLVGTSIWMYWNYRAMHLAYQLAQKKGFYGDLGWSFFCAWIVLHLNGLTQVNFWEGKVLHQMMWSLGLLFIAQKHSTRQAP